MKAEASNPPPRPAASVGGGGGLSARERALGLGFLALIFVIANLFLWRALLIQSGTLQTGIRQKEDTRTITLAILERRPTAEARAQWLTQRLAVLGDEMQATSHLLQEIKARAKDTGVTIENPVVNSAERREHARFISVAVDTKSDWQGFVKFLARLQQPDELVTVENFDVHTDAESPSVIRGKFTIAKAYAP